ncbi:Protein lin-28 A [Saguinus oedipus]|uniref:Protein lin-28 A n=1 Tax=Saguinus oedipus TaxID=9490 RepID=A0ABQ9U6T2_SAGOE|nr:Protein lin-28 A [Saguinus oedipus]
MLSRKGRAGAGGGAARDYTSKQLGKVEAAQRGVTGPGATGSADYLGLRAAEEAPEEAPEDAARAADEPQLLHRAGIWFGFLSMTPRTGVALDPSVDVFVHQRR